MILLRIIIVLLVLVTFVSCATSNNISFITGASKFTKKLVYGGDFLFTTYYKYTNDDEDWVVYIEGDGLISFDRYTISSDPTPITHLMIQLAFLDTRPNVLYIARPCQYTPMYLNPKCNPIYWTHKRWSKDTIKSMYEAIIKFTKTKDIDLVGFSGGGGIAVLLAAYNMKVKSILTIGGNLDHISFNRYHNATTSFYSLNPIDYASKLNNIPQLHLSGDNDRIVPYFITQNYTNISNSKCVKDKLIKNVDHTGWLSKWKEILNIPINCN